MIRQALIADRTSKAGAEENQGSPGQDSFHPPRHPWNWVWKISCWNWVWNTCKPRNSSPFPPQQSFPNLRNYFGWAGMEPNRAASSGSSGEHSRLLGVSAGSSQPYGWSFPTKQLPSLIKSHCQGLLVGRQLLCVSQGFKIIPGFFFHTVFSPDSI